MSRRPPRYTRTNTLLPYPTPFRSRKGRVAGFVQRLAAAAPDGLRVLDPLCIRRAGGLACVEFGEAQRHVVDRRVPGGTKRRPVLASRQCGQPHRAERAPPRHAFVAQPERLSLLGGQRFGGVSPTGAREQALPEASKEKVAAAKR